MPTPQQILVPFDYSAAAEAALRFAADLAHACQAKLLVHHFVELEVRMLDDYPVIKGDPIAEEGERLRAHVQRLLAAAGRGPAQEVEISWGSPLLRIVETAIERKADLIVLGAHGRTGVLVGSLAERTVRLAPCPVLTVRGPVSPGNETASHVAPHAGDAGTGPARVARVMTPSPVTIGPGDSLAVARDRMLDAGIRHLPVVDGGRLVGIVSDVDLPAHRGRFAHTRVDAAMTPDPVVIGRGATIADAARLMLERRVRALPVVEGTQLVGVLSVVDILEDYVRASREDT
jgi:CBS domain-containing protein